MRTRVLGLTLVLAMAPLAAFAGDVEFDRIVKAIESHYGTKPQHIPFMGVANFVLSVAHPEGASGIKLAVFENLKADPQAWRERDRFMDSLPGPNLHPLVRVHSRRDGEATYIFMGPATKASRVLIATFEHEEATVVEVKANIDQLLKSLDDPSHARITLEGSN